MSPRRRAVPSGVRAEHKLSSEGSRYDVWAGSAKVLRAFRQFSAELELASFVDLLEVDPHRRVPGKTKKLKGRLSDTIQYDLPDGNRARYRVVGRDVFLVYVGRHPKKGG